MRKLTTEEFIDRSKITHGDKYDYSKSIYKSGTSNVIIICKVHGEFKQSPQNHMRGSGCPLCNPFEKKMSQADFIDKIYKINPSLKILSEIDGNRSRVIVEDENGILYNVLASTLLKGSVPSIETAIDKNKAFEIKARLIHGDKYNYSSTNYTKHCNYVDIICPIHGKFTQNAGNHLWKHGCPKCGEDRTTEYNKENPVGWTLHEWKNLAEQSPYFDGYRVYILECFDDNERFIKIGRTFSSVQRRFCNKERLPYNYNIIREIIDENPFHIFKLESKLKREFSKYKYTPKLFFKGMNECFSPDILNDDNINKYVNT